MAIDLTPGYIYFLESEAGTNQDWITLGGATYVDLTNFTEGIEYCKLKMPRTWKKSFNTGMKVEDAGGAYSYQERDNKRHYKMLAQGIETSIANADLIEQFFTHPNHTSSIEATYKDYYMIILFSATSFVNFTDHTGTRRDYCKGAVLDGDLVWADSKPQSFIARLMFRSVWN